MFILPYLLDKKIKAAVAAAVHIQIASMVQVVEVLVVPVVVVDVIKGFMFSPKG